MKRRMKRRIWAVLLVCIMMMEGCLWTSAEESLIVEEPSSIEESNMEMAEAWETADIYAEQEVQLVEMVQELPETADENMAETELTEDVSDADVSDADVSGEIEDISEEMTEDLEEIFEVSSDEAPETEAAEAAKAETEEEPVQFEEAEEDLAAAIECNAGDSISSATSISLGRTYSGTISATNAVDYYGFTLTSSGRVTLNASAGIRYLYYYIYDSAGNEVWYKSCSWDSTTSLISTSENIDLTSGTYYFVAKKNSSYTGNYSFSLSHVSSNESFAETGTGTNNLMSAASAIAVNRTYNGQIALNDTVDFYKFTLPTSGRVVLNASAGIRYLYYYIYDSAGKEVWYKYSSWNSTTSMISTSENIDLTSGTYYFVVKRNSGYTGNYSFNLSYTSSNESFAETGTGTNNLMSAANPISANTTYKGQLALNDAVDFYKFTVGSSGKITLTASASMRYIDYYIYDSTGKQVWYKYCSWNSTTGMIDTTANIDLTAGTYYLAVKRDGSSYTGNYSFSLGYHTHSYTTTVTKATLSSNGKIVKKCSCGDSLTTTIYRPYTFTLSAASVNYTGSALKPAVIVKDSAGNIISGSSYTVSYSNNINPGKGTVKITFKGNYSGTKSLTFTIAVSLKKTSITSVTALKKGFKVKWKKQSQITGYQIQYSTNKSFRGYVYTKNVKGASKKAVSIRKLIGKKKYYVRIRTYKVIKGTTYYSKWSGKKSIKTKN